MRQTDNARPVSPFAARGHLTILTTTCGSAPALFLLFPASRRIDYDDDIDGYYIEKICPMYITMTICWTCLLAAAGTTKSAAGAAQVADAGYGGTTAGRALDIIPNDEHNNTNNNNTL